MKLALYFIGIVSLLFFHNTELKGQVNITYVVDVSLYLDSGNVLDSTGMRIGGRFSSMGINNIPDWTPSSSPCAMTHLGFNKWSITIQYPDSAKGKFQDFKFVNGNWGPGRDERSAELAGCGYISGGIVNRRIMIPNQDSTFRYCWNRCNPCPIQFSVLTGEASAVTSTSATVSGFISGTGIIQQGIVYGTNPNPTIQNSFAIDAGTGDGSFSATLSNLNPGTTYYFKSFAKRNSGTTYGNVASFTTMISGQLVPVTFRVNITNYLAEGNVLGSGGIRIAGDFTKRGAMRGSNPIPDWNPADSNSLMQNLGNNLWSITIAYPDSSLGKVQRFRYVNTDLVNAENSDSLIAGGCALLESGNINRIYTIGFLADSLEYCWNRCSAVCGPAPSAPVVSANQANNISFHSALIPSNATGNGILLRGICYSTSPAPDTSANIVLAPATSGNADVLLEGLSPGTTYFARAFAANNIGISYSQELSFSTVQAFDITYRVDISNYLAAGNTVGANGIRIGGNFSDMSSTLPNWTPSAAACAMTNEGNNFWSITVFYPESAAGQTQRYKFVNNDWGTNEGSPNLVTGGCGVVDGADVNRILVLPSGGSILTYCWDECSTSCEVSVNDDLNASGFSIYPNPFEDRIQLTSLKGGRITLLNLVGKTEFVTEIAPGIEEIKIPELKKGLYFLRHSEGKTVPVLRK
jgi:hypothetical protein